MSRRQFGVWIIGAVSIATILRGLVRESAAQAGAVRIVGRVTWIAGQKMVVTPPGGLPVPVDLSDVDVSQYGDIVSGDRVMVTGRLSPDRDRVIAVSVQRLES